VNWVDPTGEFWQFVGIGIAVVGIFKLVKHTVHYLVRMNAELNRPTPNGGSIVQVLDYNSMKNRFGDIAGATCDYGKQITPSIMGGGMPNVQIIKDHEAKVDAALFAVEQVLTPKEKK
jgi:hypothetical protein